MVERSPRSFQILGVLNVTPDSFSDGGQYLEAATALRHMQSLLDDGADLIDIGAESTRPGSEPVDSKTEWARLEPILQAIKQRGLIARVSVDTRKPDIMLKSASMGIKMVNCLAKIDDSSWLADLARAGVEVIAMHMHGEPKTMQNLPLRGMDAVASVAQYFASVARQAEKAKLPRERLWLDPGIGFGKDDTANLMIMREYATWSKQYNMVAGVSRKGFLGRLFGIEVASERDDVSNAMEMGLVNAGARLVRTHRVSTLHNYRTRMA